MVGLLDLNDTNPEVPSSIHHAIHVCVHDFKNWTSKETKNLLGSQFLPVKPTVFTSKMSIFMIFTKSNYGPI